MLGVLVLTLLCVACNVTSKQSSTDARHAISILLSDESLAISAAPTVREFYLATACNPVWIADKSLSKKGEELLRAINTCDQYGLFPEDYPLTFLNSSTAQPLEAADAARVDIMLTDCYFVVAHQLQNGTLNRQTLEQFSFNTVDTALIASLYQALKVESVLDQLASHEPRHPCYAALKQSLQQRLAALACGEDYPGIYDDIVTLQLNLERWRWQHNAQPERHIQINIPSYMLYLVADDSVVFRSKVIVGSSEHPTPMLASQITCLSLFPAASIVDLILEREPLQLPFEFPKGSASTGNSANGPAEIQLIPGNPCRTYLDQDYAHNVYREKIRALSDGCIRIESANELARLLLCENDPEDKVALEYALNLRCKAEFQLRNPVPVVVTYCTFDCDSAWTDVYGLDDELRIAVENPVFNLGDFATMSLSSPASGGR